MKALILSLILLNSSLMNTNKVDPVEIQKKVIQAYELDYNKGTDENLKKIYESSELKEDNYWKAYCTLYLATIKNNIHNDNKKQAKKYLEEGIEILESKKQLSGEDNALLSILYGYLISFSSKFSSINLADKAKKYGMAAIRYDKHNSRALYSLAVLDFYTPAIFGGGTKVKDYLDQAIASYKLNKTKDINWGENFCYALYVQYYWSKKNKSKVRDLLEKGLNKCPNDPSLNLLKRKLSSKL